MDKQELVDEWMRFAYMDFDNAKYLFDFILISVFSEFCIIIPLLGE